MGFLLDTERTATFTMSATQAGVRLDGVDAIFAALFKVIGWVDGEHHHIHKAGIQNAVGDFGGIGRATDVAHNALIHQGFYVVQNTDFQ